MFHDAHRPASACYNPQMTSRPYSPSPRPVYDRPTLIREADVTRHVWGDGEAGEVADWIYASTQRLHCLVFGLAPGGRFEHSEEFRTLFGADELMLVLEGEMLLANPGTGETLRVPEGEMAFFRAGTWHHAFALGDRPLRTIEFFAPPPATGTSGPTRVDTRTWNETRGGTAMTPARARSPARRPPRRRSTAWSPATLSGGSTPGCPSA